MNANEIIPGLWQGDQGCGLEAAQEGFDMVVNLTASTDNLAALYPGLLYIGWPIDDGPLPSIYIIRTIAEAIGFLYTEVREEPTPWRIMIHCGAGINRAGLIMGATLKFLFPEKTGQEVIEMIRSKRPGALSNQAFAGWIASL
jgi:protein-tyrosine phosphatase